MSKRGLFDFVNAIQEDQSLKYFDDLSPEEQKDYANTKYMINRVLSMETTYLPIINELQQFNTIPARSHYQYLTNFLPKKKTYNKYIKAVKSKQYDAWLVELVSTHYSVSKIEATTYLDIFYKNNKEALRDLCMKYGTDPKLIKKAKI